jgi:hypothetical protein
MYRSLFDRRTPIVYVSIVLVYGLGLVEHWFNTEYKQDTGTSFFDKVTSSLIYEGSEHGEILNRPETIAVYAEQLPSFVERIADNFGISLLIFLAVIACLFWLSSRCRTKDTFSMTVATVLLLGITLVFPFFGLRNIMPTRWFAFIYLFLSIMASFAITKLSTRSGRKPIACLVPFFVVIVLTFFMISGTTANDDSPLWLEESTISTTYTIQELSGAKTFSSHSSDFISDVRFGSSILREHLGKNYESLSMKDIVESKEGIKGQIFVWRSYMTSRPIRSLQTIEGYYAPVEGTEVLGENALAVLQIHQKVYENDDIAAYYLR